MRDALSVLALLVAVGALVLAVRDRSPGAAVDNPLPPNPQADWLIGGQPPDRVASLSDRVLALEGQVATLKEENDRLRRRAGKGHRARRDDAPMVRHEQLMEALDGDQGQVRERMAEIMGEELQNMQERRREERTERRLKRVEQNVLELVDEVGLDEDQVAQLTTLMLDEAEQIRAAFRSARDEGSWPEARATAEALHKSTEEQARELLNDEQFTAWQDRRQADRQRRFRPD